MSEELTPRPMRPSELARQAPRGPAQGDGVATADDTVYEVVPRSTHIALPDGLIAQLWLEHTVDHPVHYRIDVTDPATHVTLADGMRFILQRKMPGEPVPETREFIAKVTPLKNYATVGARGAERQFKMEWTIHCLWRAGPSVTDEVQVINLPPTIDIE